jgi:hypothetical protein
MGPILYATYYIAPLHTLFTTGKPNVIFTYRGGYH